MYVILLEWRTPWSVEQQVLEAETLEAAQATAARYKRPGIRVRILEVSREVPLEAPAPPAATPDQTTAAPSPSLAESTKTSAPGLPRHALDQGSGR